MRPRILVVDDEPQLREILKEELEIAGYEVVEADGVAAALDLMCKANFEVIITDVRMPFRTGLDLLKTISESSVVTKPKVFLVSGFADIKPSQAIALGAVNLLEKPYEFDQILSEVAKCIEVSRPKIF